MKDITESQVWRDDLLNRIGLAIYDLEPFARNADNAMIAFWFSSLRSAHAGLRDNFVKLDETTEQDSVPSVSRAEG